MDDYGLCEVCGAETWGNTNRCQEHQEDCFEDYEDINYEEGGYGQEEIYD